MTNEQIINALDRKAKRLAAESTIVGDYSHAFGCGVYQQIIIELLTDTGAKDRLLKQLEGEP